MKGFDLSWLERMHRCGADVEGNSKGYQITILGK